MHRASLPPRSLTNQMASQPAWFCHTFGPASKQAHVSTVTVRIAYYGELPVCSMARFLLAVSKHHFMGKSQGGVAWKGGVEGLGPPSAGTPRLVVFSDG